MLKTQWKLFFNARDRSLSIIFLMFIGNTLSLRGSKWTAACRGQPSGCSMGLVFVVQSTSLEDEFGSKSPMTSRHCSTLVSKLGKDSLIFYCIIYSLQRWRDVLLRWNAYEFDNIRQVVLRPDQIWTPDVVLFNAWVEINWRTTWFQIRFSGKNCIALTVNRP